MLIIEARSQQPFLLSFQASNADPYLVTGKIMETMMADFEPDVIAAKNREIVSAAAPVEPIAEETIVEELAPETPVVDEPTTPDPVVEEPKPSESTTPAKPQSKPAFNDPYSSDPVEFTCCRG